MRKTRINPHQLVDRLEKKYQKKTRFQRYKTITNYFRQTVFHDRSTRASRSSNDSPDIFDYEYIG